MESVTIQLDVEAAKIYRAASPGEQAKLSILLSILLRHIPQTSRSLASIMDEIGTNAESSGLTEEMLKSLLAP